MTKGLSMVSSFSASLRRPATRVGVEALAHALLKNCLRLKKVDLYGIDDEEHVQRMVDEMVLAAASSTMGLPYWFVVSTPQIPPLHRPPIHQPTRKALLLLRLTVFDASDIGTVRQLIRPLLAKDCAKQCCCGLALLACARVVDV